MFYISKSYPKINDEIQPKLKQKESFPSVFGVGEWNEFKLKITKTKFMVNQFANMQVDHYKLLGKK